MINIDLSSCQDVWFDNKQVDALYLVDKLIWQRQAYEPSLETDFWFTTTADTTIKRGGSSTSNNLYYSFDHITWTQWRYGDTVNISVGDKLYVKGGASRFYSNGMFYIYFKSDDTTPCLSVHGNITVLLDDSEQDSKYAAAFYNLKNLMDASELVLPTTLQTACFKKMFQGCINLVHPPKLPATVLVEACYDSMFYRCTSLEAAPELPATTLADSCYYEMFRNCTSLNYIKMLATDISATDCLYYWVEGVAETGTFVKDVTMTSLPTGINGIPSGWVVEDVGEIQINALKFTAVDDTVNLGFTNKTSAVLYSSTDGDEWTSWDGTAISISAGDSVYIKGENTRMATSTSAYSYFTTSGSGKLECSGNIMHLLGEYVTEITSNYCFCRLFYNCKNLVIAPELPATTMTNYCYYGMFRDCTSLTAAPSILPATTLASGCYGYMFMGCTSLETAPELPATTLISYCYNYMFYNCSSLNYIKMLATDISAYDCLYVWVNYVSSSGTFVKNIEMNSLPTGTSGIPSGWTVEDNAVINSCSSLTITADDVIGNATTTNVYYTAICEVTYDTGEIGEVTLTGTGISEPFESNTSTSDVQRTVSFTCYGVTATTTITQTPSRTTDTALMFTAIDNSVSLGYTNAGGNSVILYASTDNGATWFNWDGTNITLSSPGDSVYVMGQNDTISESSSVYTSFTTSGSGKLECMGNVMHLLGPDVTEITHNYCFCRLFYNCKNLVIAPELPATTMTNYCYQNMFYGCSSLESAPSLPATTLAGSCYTNMFGGCTSLTTAPELPATTLTSYCYNSMFSGCKSLATAPALPATTLGTYCYASMFYNCASLTTAPSLPATTLATYCYYTMFSGCTSLETAPALPATTLANNCYDNMFAYCTSLTTAPSILPATTLTLNCYQYMFRNCTLLETAPELPATTLVTYCYYYMFYKCSSLNYIKMMATNIPTSLGLSYWVSGVSSTGTFVKDASMTSLTTGENGIPSGWTVVDAA